MLLQWTVFAATTVAIALLCFLAIPQDPDVGKIVVHRLPGEVTYLAPRQSEDGIAQPELLRQAGIEVVTLPDSSALLQFSTGTDLPTDPIAVIVDKDWMDRAGVKQWLQTLKENGVVIVGARLNASALLRDLDAGIADAGFGNYSGNRNFYSLYAECVRADGSNVGTAEDYLDVHPETQFRLLLSRIASSAEGIKACRQSA
jgi:hypothetical protein